MCWSAQQWGKHNHPLKQEPKILFFILNMTGVGGLQTLPSPILPPSQDQSRSDLREQISPRIFNLNLLKLMLTTASSQYCFGKSTGSFIIFFPALSIRNKVFYLRNVTAVLSDSDHVFPDDWCAAALGKEPH